MTGFELQISGFENVYSTTVHFFINLNAFNLPSFQSNFHVLNCLTLIS